MLSGLRFKNFKSFRDTPQIDLAPLTFLAGVNSAGKSSIIQVLLLLKQTLESAPTFALNLNRGALLEQSLGERFNEFIYRRPPLAEANLSIGVSFTYKNDKHSELYDDLKALLPAPPIDLIEQLINHHLSFTFTWGPTGRFGQSAIRVAELKTILRLGQEALIGMIIRPVGDENFQIETLSDSIHSSLVGLNFNQLEMSGFSHFLPDPFHLSYQKQNDLNFLPAAIPTFYKDLFAAARRDLSENLYYLNSFRRPPERFYTTGQGNEEQLLPDGSNFAPILWNLRKRKVKYRYTEAMNIEAFLPDATLQVMANVLHLPQKITVEPVGDREDVLEVMVETLGPLPIRVNLASVGLGYNQVLPIVVQGLLTPPGATLIVEEPEIHLHPEVQAQLVQFFVGLIHSGRRVLIETHSSQMIDHLCLEIVKDRNYRLEEKTSIFFIHPPDDKSPNARLETVKIDSYGVIQNYPPNFLPDIVNTYEQIVREGFRKRKSKESQDN